MPEITEADLARWQAATDAATPPPWRVNEHYQAMLGRSRYVEGPNGCVAETGEHPGNVEFIAVAREAMPRLLAEVARLSAENAGLVDTEAALYQTEVEVAAALGLETWGGEELGPAISGLVGKRDKLQAFKDFTHAYLDAHGVPAGDPTNQHQIEGCRIGARLDLVLMERDILRIALDRLVTAVASLKLHQDDWRDVLPLLDAARATLEDKTDGP